MKYRRAGNVDVSEIAFDCGVARDLPQAGFDSLVEKALALGVDFFCTLQPAETTALGECLAHLGARRKAVTSAGVARFFAAYSAHHMPADEFLEHELSDRLERLGGNYVDCFVLDLGDGRGVDLESVQKAEIHAAADRRAVATKSYEGGIFLHETLADCLDVLDRFKKQGRIRLIGVSGENVTAVRRVLVKHDGLDVAFVPYNYAFRAAGGELLSIAAEVKTAVVATRPLWWGIREIPVSVLAESPYPPEQAAVNVKTGPLEMTSCKWPLGEVTVASVLAEARTGDSLAEIAAASGETHWTKSDEEMLKSVAAVATAQNGLFLVLSAMNSRDENLRARGWAACLRMGLPDFSFDPAGKADARLAALKSIAASVVQTPPSIAPEDLDELL